MSSITPSILALPDELMTSAQTAEMLKLSPRTLDQMRVDGSGPPFLKAGGGNRSRVLYSRRAVAEWLAQFSFNNTSQYRRNAAGRSPCPRQRTAGGMTCGRNPSYSSTSSLGEAYC